MKFQFCRAAAAILAASLVVSYAQAQAGSTATATKRHKKPSAPPAPSVQEQIDALRQQMQGQIDSLKSNLAEKDAQLR
jgi:Skp family chaperone for outer membrane proteins